MAEINVDNTNFDQEVLASSVPVLVDFWATWCGPCRMLGPVISQLAEEYEGRLKVCKVDVSDNEDLAIKYGVSNIPAVKIFKNGEIAAETLGAAPYPAMKKFVDDNI